MSRIWSCARCTPAASISFSWASLRTTANSHSPPPLLFIILLVRVCVDNKSNLVHQFLNVESKFRFIRRRSRPAHCCGTESYNLAESKLRYLPIATVCRLIGAKHDIQIRSLYCTISSLFADARGGGETDKFDPTIYLPNSTDKTLICN